MRNLITGAALIVLAAFAPMSAHAADIAPVYKAPPAPVTTYSWTGFYIGGNAGYSWSESDATYVQPPGTPGFFGGAPFDVNGFSRTLSLDDRFVGGGQIGYNWQAGNWVFGIESDLQWRNSSGSFSEVFPQFADVLTMQSEEKWFGTTRGRVGWAVNNWLYYATGGVAYGRVEDTVTRFCAALCNRFEAQTSSRTLTGWTVGGGVEAIVWQNWTIGAEYLYVDLGDNTVVSPGIPGTALAPPASTDFEHRFHVANEPHQKAGLAPAFLRLGA